MINLKEEHAAENAKRGEELMKKLNAKMGANLAGLGFSTQKNKENLMQTPDKTAGKSVSIGQINDILARKK